MEKRHTLDSSDINKDNNDENEVKYRRTLWIGGIVALVSRLIVILYSVYHDSHFLVKYTDVDYFVFTDAARFVSNAQSPYNRHTYRYSPILAFLLTGNIWIHESFGKILFALIDILLSYLIYKITKDRGVSTSWSVTSAALYAFNPIVFNVSTRGNADALIALMVGLTLFYLQRRQYIAAAIWFGLAVHFRIYPVFFGIPIVLYIVWRNWSISSIPQRFRDGIVFTVLSASIFFLVNAVFYYIYGYEFLHETYLYHLSRSDNRHNFSVYFYHLYLDGVRENAKPPLFSLLAFLPQLVLMVLVGCVCFRDLPVTLLFQTFIFVTFNKVCTVQYFVWYFCLLPLALPFSTMRKYTAAVLLGSFFVTQGLWLNEAYKLEFLGQNTFFHIWICGLIFFGSNIVILSVFMHRYHLTAFRFLPPDRKNLSSLSLSSSSLSNGNKSKTE